MKNKIKFILIPLLTIFSMSSCEFPFELNNKDNFQDNSDNNFQDNSDNNFKGKWNLTLINQTESYGLVSGEGSFDFGEIVTITASPNTGYTFDGWYLNETKISDLASYSFTMPNNDIEYTANFTKNYYQVNLLSEDSNKGTVTGDGIYSFEEEVTICVSPNLYSLNKFEFLGWFNGNVCVSKELEYKFLMPAEDVNYIAKFEDEATMKTVGDKYYFGLYPQSQVIDNSLIESLNKLVGSLPNESDSKNWFEYDWYIENSNSLKFGWFFDVDIDKDGVNDYRAVYFTRFRPDVTGGDIHSWRNEFQSLNGYETHKIYWFKYEPIEWEILSFDNNDYFIMTEKIIDSQQFSVVNSSDLEMKTDYQGNSGLAYSNNYQFSDIRQFLNTNFYNTAFNELEKNYIQETIVDNSINSSGFSVNQYVCNDTNDKIFILSYAETKKFSSKTLSLKVTDYAACMGCYVTKDNTYVGLPFYLGGQWWTRSPYNMDPNRGRTIDVIGGYTYDGSLMCQTHYGVAPALHCNFTI